eukprot:CAMPEP_0181223576 /NCGR_PEP_ID=MMETSP1096-20121128/30624_1 /TAXON_ID=156174 ORGANISM="Chrysochromulina ericina, Strain CCMP281" /NCGR_SAMPLE_ID=MMETSP1096 /ASSEMBLY_ACC=CAM_ASM_000453 /LENGTH=182 /DNA_ID=CAMNT_0023316515 /DNA_START=511 /DNA_END=1058 /DNA_ORIENTATION=-
MRGSARAPKRRRVSVLSVEVEIGGGGGSKRKSEDDCECDRRAAALAIVPSAHPALLLVIVFEVHSLFIVIVFPISKLCSHKTRNWVGAGPSHATAKPKSSLTIHGWVFTLGSKWTPAVKPKGAGGHHVRSGRDSSASGRGGRGGTTRKLRGRRECALRELVWAGMDSGVAAFARLISQMKPK